MRNNQKDQLRTGSGVGRGWIGVIAASVSVAVAAFLFWKGGRTAQPNEVTLRRRQLKNHIVDDRGTGQDEAAQILRKLRDRAFNADAEKLALALGRSIEQVEAWEAGLEIIDDDAVMKARGIAMHRGVVVE